MVSVAPEPQLSRKAQKRMISAMADYSKEPVGGLRGAGTRTYLLHTASLHRSLLASIPYTALKSHREKVAGYSSAPFHKSSGSSSTRAEQSEVIVVAKPGWPLA